MNNNLDLYYKAIGEAILFASIQFSIGSVEMSSKFSVMNFSKDQETLQKATRLFKYTYNYYTSEKAVYA